MCRAFLVVVITNKQVNTRICPSEMFFLLHFQLCAAMFAIFRLAIFIQVSGSVTIAKL